MYELLDKSSAIKEIQKFLYVISDKVNTEVPRISIDGIYGEETENAVKTFQDLYGIIPTGIVDRITFDLLFKLYNENSFSTDKSYIDENLFPVKVGSQGNHVLNIHLLMLELREKYKDIGNILKSTYFSEESKRVTQQLQKIFRYIETGVVDYQFYQRMLLELDSLKRLNELYN